MEWSDYKDEVKADAMDAIDENVTWFDTWDDMYDSLSWTIP